MTSDGVRTSWNESRAVFDFIDSQVSVIVCSSVGGNPPPQLRVLRGRTDVTAEFQYNGFALGKQAWANLGATSIPGQIAYLTESQRLQELVPRQAILIYVTQKGLGLKDLDLTAFLRVNALDNSRIAWVELRHHWTNFDAAFQLQQHMGRSTSEFGILPDRRVMQVLGTFYF